MTTAKKHVHEIVGSTAVEIANGKHIHFFDAITDVSDGYRHRFQDVSLIEVLQISNTVIKHRNYFVISYIIITARKIIFTTVKYTKYLPLNSGSSLTKNL